MAATHNSPDAEARCPEAGVLVDFAMADTGQSDDPVVRAHVDECAACRRHIEELRCTVRTLVDTDAPVDCRDLVPEILARIPERQWAAGTARHRAWSARPLKLAAGFLLLLGGALLSVHLLNRSHTGAAAFLRAERTSVVQRGLAWLTSRQEASGGWNVESLGGRPEYASALGGLAVLAIARSGVAGPDREAALRAAAGFLVRQQSADGRFGEDFDGTMYNQGIATLAMLDVYRATHDDALRRPIDHALAFIRARQTASGGWSYQPAVDAQPNTSITAWQVQALLSALQQGWTESESALRRGLAWMTRTVDDRGFFGYERPRQFPDGPGTLTMMGAYCALSAARGNVRLDDSVLERIRRGLAAMAREQPEDYYGTFFYTAALAEAPASSFPGALDALRKPLLAGQNSGGQEAGSWPANDRWNSAGGRLYSTSMSLLSLSVQ